MAAEFGLTCISAHRMDATKALLKPATAYPEEEPGENQTLTLNLTPALTLTLILTLTLP